MKEVKFRAWDKGGKKMRLVKSIRYADDGFAGTIMVYLIGVEDGYYFVHGESCELMQYTGLKDKNDKEIYEGDILKSHFDHGTGKIVYGVVVYNEATATFIARITDSTDEWLHYSELNEGNVDRKPMLEYTEIVGNIYENPELLNS